MERIKLLAPDYEIIDIKDFDFKRLQDFVPPLENLDQLVVVSKKYFLEEDRVLNIINLGNKVSQRLENLKELFKKHKRLTRKQIVESFSISAVTATKDLEELCQQGVIQQNMPTKSIKSRYFIFIENN